MDKYSWKLLKAIFFICSSICPILVAFIVDIDDVIPLGVIGIIGMGIGFFMGLSALWGHFKDGCKRVK